MREIVTCQEAEHKQSISRAHFCSANHPGKQTLCGDTSQSILSGIVIIEANARAYPVPATALSATETVTHSTLPTIL